MRAVSRVTLSGWSLWSECFLWACGPCRKRAGFSQVQFFWEASGDSSSGFVTDKASQALSFLNG